ncbi:putative dinucleotide-binding enzyme [Nocardia kruczakiae]|uniref:Dinucleotide-binding enzyme n=1 Tax=Nocardia kruczakiae TaxID=261477 RepID=A0ABU1XNB5_9NOCA|nr:NAD(P)-binding domain-containing protein [Nocardia kruczakiae]MDR7171422.1 putative dinucleotide-binding enzyme [Nocardia kruczakiae]
MRMRITILGTGTLAEALGRRWARAGHEITVAGRSMDKAEELARRLGAVRAVPLAEIAAGGQYLPGTQPAESAASTGTGARADAEAVLLAVAYTGVEEVLRTVGAPGGALSGLTLIDATNAIDHGVGVLRLPPGTSHAQRVAELAPGAHVVKAFHLFPSEQWAATEADATEAPATADTGRPPWVTICGDGPAALRTTEQLVRDVGAEPVVLGGLDRARQLEEAAGFVISLAFAGVDPSRAVPAMPTS